MKRRVAIVGAGVSGLTCGVVLQKHDFDVTIFADRLIKTTSSVAAAIWYPYDISPDNFVLAEEWAFASYDEFAALATDSKSTGVSMVTFRVFDDVPEWATKKAELQLQRFDDHFSIVVPLIETPTYLPWLRHGLHLERRTIQSLAELTADFDLVVNCAGFGARELCNDHSVKPGRGVVLTAQYAGPPIHLVTTDPELTYILTRSHDVVLGGTNDSLEDDHVPTELRAAIYARCLKQEPSLSPRYAHAAGIRPLRNVVRLEREDRAPIIHNYGHGGAGFTVSWACAREVLRLAGRQ